LVRGDYLRELVRGKLLTLRHLEDARTDNLHRVQIRDRGNDFSEGNLDAGAVHVSIFGV